MSPTRPSFQLRRRTEVVHRRPGGRQGYTLIEAVVVVAILAVILALLLGGIQKSRQASLRAGCANHLRQVALGTHLYAGRTGNFPQGCAYPFATNGTPTTLHAGLSWQSSILPDIEQQHLWQQVWRANTTDPTGMQPFTSR